MNVVNRYGPNDISLWTVDFPSSTLERISREVCRLVGDAHSVIQALPCVDKQPVTSLYLLFPGAEDQEITVCVCEVDESFLEDFCHSGCSTRGSEKMVLDEYRSIWKADRFTTFISKAGYEETLLERRNQMGVSEWERLRRTAARYKEMYPPGTRVVLNHMEDPYAPVPDGMTGTVEMVDAIGQIHMRWDNGRSLALVPGEDSFRKMTAEEIVREQEQKNEQATDLITAEDLTEQAVYAATAPDCCTEAEKAQNMLGMLGANIQDDSIYHDEDEHPELVMSM